MEEYQAEIEQKRILLEEVLQRTRHRNEVLQGQRLYRIPRILTDYSPIGIGMSASWIGVRWTLFKSSAGFVTRMTDKFARGLFKVSALLWIGLSPIANGIEEEII